MVENKKSLMTPDDVAIFLNISARTVYDYAQKGKIPAIKLGGQWRFREEDISNWLDKKLSESSSNFNDMPKSPDQLRKDKYSDAEEYILMQIDKAISSDGKVPIETIMDHDGIENKIITEVINKLKKNKIIEVNKNKKTKIEYINRRK